MIPNEKKMVGITLRKSYDEYHQQTMGIFIF